MTDQPRHASIPLQTGQRVRFTKPLDRYPHFRIDAGMTGTITGMPVDSEWGTVLEIKVDQPLGPGAGEWDNCLCWTPEDGDLADYIAVVA